MRTLPLIKAHLKGFLRNWKSVFLLLGVPLLLVTLIVASFSTQGLTGVPFGVVEQDTFNVFQYEDSYLSYLELTPYPDLETCLEQVHAYNEYGCLDVGVQESKTVITIHYDNTQEPIIWEVLQRIETTVDFLRQQQSEQAISSLLSETASTQDSFNYFQTGIQQTTATLNDYENQLLTMRSRIDTMREELALSIANTEADLRELEREVDTLDRQRQDTYSTSNTLIFQAREIEYSLPPGEEREELKALIDEFSNEVNAHNQDALRSINRAENAISNYRRANAQANNYVNELSDASEQLRQARVGVHTQKHDLYKYQNELSTLSEQLGTLGNTSTDALLRSIALSSTPTFIPDFELPGHLDTQEAITNITAQELNQAQSLISLQTLYPTILLLILLFLSLLTASFLCLQEINSAASSRIRLIPHMFSAEFSATYFSAIIISMIPVLCVLVAGEILFSLNILSSLATVLPTLLLLASSFIFFGMIVAYTLRKESITLLLSTLLLVFFMFFSGFLYPLERMNELFSVLANNLPPKTGLDAFNQAVFYGQPITQLTNELSLLLLWTAILAATALLIKYAKRQ